MMGKLHEVLAVEGDLKGKAARVISETLKTFKDKASHFDSLHRIYKPDQEDGLEQPEETKPMVETVKSKLQYTNNAMSELIDVLFQKESTNTQAKADIVLANGTVLKHDVPAVVLLSLETKLTEYRRVYENIPTLDPGDDWIKDDTTDSYVVENKKVRTKKVMKNHILAEATDKHPAQVQTYNEDQRMGLVVEKKSSSKFTPAEKSKCLARIDELIQSVKKARQRANATEASSEVLGKQLFDYILG